jgi:hypothetical protein
MWYWSIEIAAAQYLWLPEVPGEFEIEDIFKGRVAVGPSIRLVHNALHELETLWWMLLMVFVMREPKAPSSAWRKDKQQLRLHGAFPASSHSVSRDHTFRQRLETELLLDSMDESLQSFRNPMWIFTLSLKQAFAKAENFLPQSIDESVWGLNSQLFDRIKAVFKVLSEEEWPEMKEWDTTE